MSPAASRRVRWCVSVPGGSSRRSSSAYRHVSESDSRSSMIDQGLLCVSGSVWRRHECQHGATDRVGQVRPRLEDAGEVRVSKLGGQWEGQSISGFDGS
jgi:hypothetical protein